jgi:hypothetical protein
MRTAGLPIALGLLAMAAACSKSAVPTAPTAPASPQTVTFETQLYPRGAAARIFTVSEGGGVTITLTGVRPDTGAMLGVGVGIPRADGGGCLMQQSVTTVSGSAPQLTAVVDTGTYCVRVYDVGTLTSEVYFSVTLVHP